jgi:hypothetical protein
VVGFTGDLDCSRCIICNIERTIGTSIKLFYLLKKVLLVLVPGVDISFGLWLFEKVVVEPLTKWDNYLTSISRCIHSRRYFSVKHIFF